MKQGWWVAGVGLVGIVLAILLFPRPDTGEDIPEADPTNTRPSDFKNKQAGTTVVRGGRTAPAPTDPGAAEEPFTPSPEVLAQREWRSRPAATYASKILAPFSAIRFTLMKEGSPEARALADELGTGVMGDLRSVRSSKEEDPLTGMKAGMDAAVEKVNGTKWASDPTIQKHVARYQELFTEYEQVVAGGPMPAPAPVMPHEGGAVDAPPAPEGAEPTEP